MKTCALLSLCLATASAFAPVSQTGKVASSLDLTRDEIMSTPNTAELGKVFDPLGLSKLGSEETISWFRHSEIKHGRIAMFAFVGACINGLGIRFPGEIAPGLEFSGFPKGGIEAWEALPGLGKAQLLIFAFLVEFHDELFYSTRSTHYMRGGVPGKNMVPGLYDPLGLWKNKSEEQLARGRDSEIKNGRLAMIGMAGMFFASTIPGSVPLQPPI
eukprot:CAMPEP_0113461102 /NCGR_PEP_ID=MMETSP0014_2-20120614/11360_1 /TAXON_ID=2857 /ORGANISM="Nitzschia sp." /LENGTH=214 /DNA_ID=CAMNT_0000352837 /DNA_START=104 /DNA_END=748 /DNA_ORIENTATION=- /assembly_acc=CAM_ASM_000159